MFFKAIKNKWDAYLLTKSIMIVKLIHIPAYVAIFITGMFCALTVFSLPFTILFVLFDFILLAMSGIVTISAVIRAVKENPGVFKNYLWVAFLQFVYCIDVVAIIIFYFRLKKEKNKTNS